MGDEQALARALGFKTDQLLRAVERTEPVASLPGALRLSTPSLPRVWELNVLLTPPAPDRAQLASAFELLAGEPTYRMLRLPGPFAHEDALQREAAGAGWKLSRDLVMVRRRAPDRPPGPSRVREVTRDALDAAADADWSSEPTAQDPESRRQLVRQYERWEQAVPVSRRLGVVEDDRVVAWCRIHQDHEVTEIDNVVVARDRRGAGLGRMLIEAALAAAGPDRLVFLCADPEDWPQELYRRLGFDVVGIRLNATRAS